MEIIDKIQVGILQSLIEHSIFCMKNPSLSEFWPKKLKRAQVKVLPKIFSDDLAFVLGSITA